MSGHTPGPWRINHTPPVVKNSVLIDAPRLDGIASRYAIALLRKDFEDTTANARLIAAAPEMLAALEEALELLTYHYDGDGRYHSLDRPSGQTDTDCEFCRLAVQAETILTRIKGDE